MTDTEFVIYMIIYGCIGLVIGTVIAMKDRPMHDASIGGQAGDGFAGACAQLFCIPLWPVVLIAIFYEKYKGTPDE